MGMQQFNNHQKMRDHMENEYLEQQLRGEGPDHEAKGRILVWLLLLAVILAALAWTLGIL